MNAFSPIDSWIAAGGRTDAWLSLGLDLLDGWQAGSGSVEGTDAGQAHLVDVLAALQFVRPVVAAAPDPLALAVWFHHAAAPDATTLSGPAVLELSATAAYDRLSAVGEPALAREVARLVRQFGVRHPDPDDAAASLLRAAHKAAVSATHLAALPPVPRDEGDQ